MLYPTHWIYRVKVLLLVDKHLTYSVSIDLSERCALILQGDETPVVALVDVYGSEPDTHASAASGQQHRHAPVTLVHQGLFANRPGLRVLQVGRGPVSCCVGSRV